MVHEIVIVVPLLTVVVGDGYVKVIGDVAIVLVNDKGTTLLRVGNEFITVNVKEPESTIAELKFT